MAPEVKKLMNQFGTDRVQEAEVADTKLRLDLVEHMDTKLRLQQGRRISVDLEEFRMAM